MLAENLGIGGEGHARAAAVGGRAQLFERPQWHPARETLAIKLPALRDLDLGLARQRVDDADPDAVKAARGRIGLTFRSEEHTSELQYLMRISYAVFCLKKKS